MADLNSMIAQGAQFQAPVDPFAQYGRMQQLQQGQNQNELARYTMAKAQQEDVTRNALNQAYQSNMNPTTGEINYTGVYKSLAGANAGASIPAIQKSQFEVEKEKAGLAKTNQEVFALKNKALGTGLIAALQDPSDAGLGRAFDMLDSQGIPTKDLRTQFAAIPDPAKRLEIIKSYVSAHPEGIAALNFVKPSPTQITRPDGKIIFVDNNPNSPTFKQEILPAQAAGMTPYQIGNLKVDQQQLRVSQGNQRLAQEKFNWEKANPGKTIKEVEQADGTIQIFGIDNRTGVATPVKLAGAPGPAMPGQGRPAVDGGDVALTGKKRPSATAEKTAIQRKQLGLDLDRAIIELTDVTKDGGLIDQSTGSGAGRLYDVGAGFIGQAPSGAIAIGKLQPIADMALKMVPRFEGPQSNADTTSYKQAAGQLADPTMPTKIRKEAGKTVLRLMKDRKGQFASTAMEAEGVAPAPAGGGSIRDQADAILRGGN